MIWKSINAFLAVAFIVGCMFWGWQQRRLDEFMTRPLLEGRDPRAQMEEQKNRALWVSKPGPGNHTYQFWVNHDSKEQVDVSVRVFGVSAKGEFQSKSKGFRRKGSWCRFRFIDGHVMCLVQQPTWRDSDFVLYRIAHGEAGKLLCEIWNELEFTMPEVKVRGEVDLHSKANVLRVALPVRVQERLSQHANQQVRELAAKQEVFAIDLTLVPRKTNDG